MSDLQWYRFVWLVEQCWNVKIKWPSNDLVDQGMFETCIFLYSGATVLRQMSKFEMNLKFKMGLRCMRSRKSPSKIKILPCNCTRDLGNFNLLWYTCSVDVRYLFHHCKQDARTLICELVLSTFVACVLAFRTPVLLWQTGSNLFSQAGLVIRQVASTTQERSAVTFGRVSTALVCLKTFTRWHYRGKLEWNIISCVS